MNHWLAVFTADADLAIGRVRIERGGVVVFRGSIEDAMPEIGPGAQVFMSLEEHADFLEWLDERGRPSQSEH